MPPRVLPFAAMIVCALFLAMTACGGVAWAKPLKVVATFTILGDMVRQIGGEEVVVRTLVGSNGDTHVYEPVPADVRAVTEAGLLVINGLGMEGWMERLSKAADYKGATVVASTGVKIRKMAKNGKKGDDPHAWQDLSNGRLYVANIADGLIRADPTHAEIYRANAERYSGELTALEAWVRSEIGSVAESKRKVITSHDAFGYFGEAYGVTFLAPEGISTEAEATAKDLAELVKQVRKSHIKALFVENMADSRLIELLAREAGTTIGGALYVDALSPAEGPAASYVAMFRHNVRQLKSAMMGN